MLRASARGQAFAEMQAGSTGARDHRHMTQLADPCDFPDESAGQPLDGVRLKLSRAMEHLLRLDDEIDEYRAREPFKVLREVDPGDARLRFGFFLTELPPAHLSVVIGDIVNNLRSSLDHLAWQLVIANGGTPQTSPPTTQFPLHRSRTTSSGKLRKIEIAGGVAPKALAAVESLQPYHRVQDPGKHPLALLAELSNIDKHRTLHTASMGNKDIEVTLVRENGERIRATAAEGPVRHGDVLAIFPLTFDDLHPLLDELTIEIRGSTFVSLRDPGPWGDQPVTLLLEGLLNYLRDSVVSRFERFF